MSSKPWIDMGFLDNVAAKVPNSVERNEKIKGKTIGKLSDKFTDYILTPAEISDYKLTPGFIADQDKFIIDSILRLLTASIHLFSWSSI
jgi:hypothetical protein